MMMVVSLFGSFIRDVSQDKSPVLLMHVYQKEVTSPHKNYPEVMSTIMKLLLLRKQPIGGGGGRGR